MEFKEILKTRRAELDLTLDDVARYVGVSGATVSRWENGDIENIRRDKIAKLAEVLKVTPSYLMGWDDRQTAMGDEHLQQEADPVFFRLKKGLEPYNVTESDVDFIINVYKLHKEQNRE